MRWEARREARVELPVAPGHAVLDHLQVGPLPAEADVSPNTHVLAPRLPFELAPLAEDRLGESKTRKSFAARSSGR
jgi:hypothetical protein